MYEMQVGLGFDPISYDEIMRAAIWYDIALILFTAGAIWAEKRIAKLERRGKVFAHLPLRRSIVQTVSIASFLVGLVMFAIYRGGSAAQLGTFGDTGYAKLMANWPIMSLLSLMYVYGFQPFLFLSFAFFLIFNALQGYHRVMTVVPLLFVIFIYLERKNRRWPNLGFVLILVGLFTIFPVLKHIGRAYQSSDLQTATQLARESASNSLKLSAEYAPDFLDQFACCLSLADESGKVYYGLHYSYLLVYMVPRALWPNKPLFASYMMDLGNEVRPIHREGRIITYLGESYVHFRYVGLILYPLLLSYFLTAWFARVRKCDFLTLNKYVYMIFAVSFLQVYRDGLPSLLMFTFVQNLPALITLVLHLQRARAKKPFLGISKGSFREQHIMPV